jgi:N-acetylmuramoyl-L-alanine amidase-like protein
MPWFDCAIRRPISANTGGMLSPNLGLVLHHAVMNGSGWHFFNSPSAQVSAHFWVLQNGTIEQYVDTNVVAWHGRSLNSRYVGVETEGCTKAPHADPMSDAMVNALARLYAEGARRHGWANALANSDGQRGFGFHRMAVATGCPCDVRLNMRQEILRRAFGGAPIPPGGADLPLDNADKAWIEDCVNRVVNIQLRTLFVPDGELFGRTIQSTMTGIDHQQGNFVKWAKEGSQQAK